MVEQPGRKVLQVAWWRTKSSCDSLWVADGLRQAELSPWFTICWPNIRKINFDYGIWKRRWCGVKQSALVNYCRWIVNRVESDCEPPQVVWYVLESSRSHQTAGQLMVSKTRLWDTEANLMVGKVWVSATAGVLMQSQRFKPRVVVCRRWLNIR